MTTRVETNALQQDVLERLMAQHAKFQNFLSARVDAQTAEDILQSAYVKAMQHGAEIQKDESTIAWFYRILRNAIIDDHRRRSSQLRAHDGYAAEAPLSYEPELMLTVCACVEDVVRNLRNEYRNAIEQVDLGEESVESFAQSQNISANNASVRLHRARKAIAKELMTVCGTCAEHKCLDCTCRRSKL